MNELRSTTLLKYDEGYETPTPEEIRAAIKITEKTGKQIGQMVGVEGRAVRRWTGGERDIPYAAWRLIIFDAKLINHKNIV